VAALSLMDGDQEGDSDGGGVAYGIRLLPHDHAELTMPVAPPRMVTMEARSDAELCAAALGPRGRDPLLRRVLAYAARLCAMNGAAGGGRPGDSR
jgi:hypothetical protein